MRLGSLNLTVGIVAAICAGGISNGEGPSAKDKEKVYLYDVDTNKFDAVDDTSLSRRVHSRYEPVLGRFVWFITDNLGQSPTPGHAMAPGTILFGSDLGADQKSGRFKLGKNGEWESTNESSDRLNLLKITPSGRFREAVVSRDALYDALYYKGRGDDWRGRREWDRAIANYNEALKSKFDDKSAAAPDPRAMKSEEFHDLLNRIATQQGTPDQDRAFQQRIREIEQRQKRDAELFDAQQAARAAEFRNGVLEALALTRQQAIEEQAVVIAQSPTPSQPAELPPNRQIDKRPASSGRPLTEKGLLALVESQIDDSTIVTALRKQGIAFSVNAETLQRLKVAGASELVIQTVSDLRGKANAISEQSLLRLIQEDFGDELIMAKLKKDGIAFEATDEVVKRLKDAGAAAAILEAIQTHQIHRGESGSNGALLRWAFKKGQTFRWQNDQTLTGKAPGETGFESRLTLKGTWSIQSIDAEGNATTVLDIKRWNFEMWQENGNELASIGSEDSAEKAAQDDKRVQEVRKLYQTMVKPWRAVVNARGQLIDGDKRVPEFLPFTIWTMPDREVDIGATWEDPLELSGNALQGQQVKASATRRYAGVKTIGRRTMHEISFNARPKIEGLQVEVEGNYLVDQDNKYVSTCQIRATAKPPGGATVVAQTTVALAHETD